MAELLPKYNEQQTAHFATTLVLARIKKWVATNKTALKNSRDAFEGSKDKQLEYMIEVFFKNPKHGSIRKIMEKTRYYDGYSFKNLKIRLRDAI